MLRNYKELLVQDLIKYTNNSRTHSDDQIQQIIASINEFGFTNPLLVDEHNMIIAGHGRLEAAIKLGIESVPCVILDGLTDAQKRAYVIADNKLALNANWDFSLLANELQELRDLSFDLSLTGFDDDELKELFDGDITSDDVFGEPKAQQYNAVFEIVVECLNESEQEKLYKEFSDKGYKCRILSM